jgi:phosphoribosyl-ATP pyrophosphohydrolase
MEARALAKLKAKAPKRGDAPLEGGDRLQRLAAAIAEVRAGARNSPRTVKLLASGPAKMAQKVVEEAAEVAIEGAIGNREAVISESVDLLYNLSTLWSALGVRPEAIWAEMDRREALLGMAEKLPKIADEDS